MAEIEQIFPENQDWQRLCNAMRLAVTLSSITLVAWQMGQWFARRIISRVLRSERYRGHSRFLSCGAALVAGGSCLSGWQSCPNTTAMVRPNAASTPAWMGQNTSLGN
jgi:hypothetical protein